MAQFLRVIRKSRWYDEEGFPWLPKDSIPADPLGDLNTKDNRLSVYYIEDDEHNLEQVIAALAANRDNISNFDYALFDQYRIQKVGIKIEGKGGGTKDEKVNIWHCDLVELTVGRIVNLAKLIFYHGKRRRVQEKDVQHLIQQAVESGSIDIQRLKPAISNKIKR